MQKKESLPVPEPGQIDPETFRRVWERVMPDQKNSPIVVPPAPNGGKTPPRPGERERTGRPGPGPGWSGPGAPRREETAARGDEEALHRLMDLAQEGVLSAQTLVRRGGNRGKSLTILAEDDRRALRRLSALCFLTTGRRYQPKGTATPWQGTLEQGLRERFWWEQEWVRACRELEQQTREDNLRELCGELAREGMAHGRLIRGILEQM